MSISRHAFRAQTLVAHAAPTPSAASRGGSLRSLGEPRPAQPTSSKQVDEQARLGGLEDGLVHLGQPRAQQLAGLQVARPVEGGRQQSVGAGVQEQTQSAMS